MYGTKLTVNALPSAGAGAGLVAAGNSSGTQFMVWLGSMIILAFIAWTIYSWTKEGVGIHTSFRRLRRNGVDPTRVIRYHVEEIEPITSQAGWQPWRRGRTNR